MHATTVRVLSRIRNLGGGGGGGVIVDNVAVGGGYGKTEAFYDLIELKKAKFQLLCDKHRHY